MLKNLTNPLITNLVKKKLKFIALNEKMRQTYLQILKTPQEFPQEIVTKAKQRLEDGGK